MDTRFWGPDGWKLLHSIAVSYPEQPSNKTKNIYKQFFNSLKLILPCIYCRNSFFQFIDDIPIEPYLKDRKSLSLWVYLMHNKVNNKLHNQGLSVQNAPDFTGIHKHYLHLVKNYNKHLCTLDKNQKQSYTDPQTNISVNNNRLQSLISVPGWDFIYSILFNYPKKQSFSIEEPERYLTYVNFFYLLAEVMPFQEFKLTLNHHLNQYPIENYLNLNSLKRWGYLLEQNYCRRLSLICPKFRERVAIIEYFRAGCNGKNDPRPTCRSN